MWRWLTWGVMMLGSACGSSAGGTIPTPPHPPLHGFDPSAYYARKALQTQRGAASYYHERFAGRLTANGERYDPNAYTAAHRTLPFDSVVRVVHERTGQWVLVRINGRGPYGPGVRIIDLSYRAASTLAMVREGVTRVRLEVLEVGSGQRKKPAPAWPDAPSR